MHSALLVDPQILYIDNIYLKFINKSGSITLTIKADNAATNE